MPRSHGRRARGVSAQQQCDPQRLTVSVCNLHCSTIAQAVNQRYNHEQDEPWPQTTMRGVGRCQAQCTHINQPQLCCEETPCETQNARAPQRHAMCLHAKFAFRQQIVMLRTGLSVSTGVSPPRHRERILGMVALSISVSINGLSLQTSERVILFDCCWPQLCQTLSNSVCPSAMAPTRKCELHPKVCYGNLNV